jgi:hypothetical protein
MEVNKMVQTSVANEQSKNLPGTIMGVQGNETASMINTTEEIEFGRGLDKISGVERGVKKSASAGGVFYGVSIRDMKEQAKAEAEKYILNSPVGVKQNGRIIGEVEGSPNPDNAVYVRFAGKPQIQTFVLDADLVSGNVITVDVDGVTVSETFASTHLATMQAFAAKIAAEAGVNTAVVGGAGDRTITITAAVNGVDVLLENEGITLGGSQANIVISETQASISDDDLGKFRVDVDNDLSSNPTAKVIANASFKGNTYTVTRLDGVTVRCAELKLNLD